MESGSVPSTPPTLKKPSVERLMAFFFFPSVAALKGDFFRPELLKLFGVNKRQLTIHAASKPVTAPRKPSRVNTLPQSEHAGRRQEVAASQLCRNATTQKSQGTNVQRLDPHSQRTFMRQPKPRRNVLIANSYKHRRSLNLRLFTHSNVTIK